MPYLEQQDSLIWCPVTGNNGPGAGVASTVSGQLGSLFVQGWSFSELGGSSSIPITKGGVRVLPFSHRQGLWPMLTRKAYFLDCNPDPDEYAIEAEAGDLTIHDGRIWHRVAEAEGMGEASQRRVMYVPLMEGPLKLKDEHSPTPLYFRLRRFARF